MWRTPHSAQDIEVRTKFLHKGSKGCATIHESEANEIRTGYLVLLVFPRSRLRARQFPFQATCIASLWTGSWPERTGLSSGISFGHEQSNETLKGTDGTVLLFVRSADSLPFCKTAARAAAKC